jgi:tetratricopeptide (TPR) repeat protein
MAAAFLQGLNLFTQRKWSQAQLQFSAALSLEPNFAPASFYLGACYAAVGRDSEAVTQWRRTLLASKTTSIEHGTLADALFRMRESNQALVFLRKALTIWPKDDALIKKLAIAHALELNYDESLAIIEPYVERNPTDHVALLLALINMFSNHVSDNEPPNDQSLERMRAYAITYATTQGPHLELVRDWIQFVNGQ